MTSCCYVSIITSFPKLNSYILNNTELMGWLKSVKEEMQLKNQQKRQ